MWAFGDLFLGFFQGPPAIPRLDGWQGHSEENRIEGLCEKILAEEGSATWRGQFLLERARQKSYHDVLYCNWKKHRLDSDSIPKRICLFGYALAAIRCTFAT